jgi:hypothetical protein
MLPVKSRVPEEHRRVPPRAELIEQTLNELSQGDTQILVRFYLRE